MNEEKKKARSSKNESMMGVLGLHIYVQSVRLPVGDDDVGEWNR
jgi:hypothetical protein